MDVLSGSTGDVSDNFATIPDVPVEPSTPRVQPNDVATGVTRGTQTYVNTDGSYMTLGLIPDGGTDFGIAFFTASGKLIAKSTSTTDYKYDTNGNLIFKNNGQTQFIYDVKNNKNIMQVGLLPDNTYGWAVARSGYNVSDGITSAS